MDFFIWKDSYNIGVEKLDQQHRHFLELLNACYLKVVNRDQKIIDPETVAELRKYATEHFRFEEELIRYKAYPDMLVQKEQHILFEKMILELEDAYAHGTGRTTESVLSFLRDWLLRHILTEDKKIASAISVAKDDISSPSSRFERR